MLLTAFGALGNVMSSDLPVMSASAFFTYKAIRISGILEEVITGFIVIAVLAGKLNKGWFLGFKGCHCDYLAFFEVMTKIIEVLEENKI